MWKKYRLYSVLKRLNLPFVFVSVFRSIEKTPTGNFSIYIRLGTGTSPTKLHKKLEHIAIGMKMEEAILERVVKNRFKITFRNKSVNTFPLYPNVNQENLNLDKVMSIPLGKNTDGYQIDLPIFTRSGGTVTLIGGLPGQGKSSALKLLVSGLSNSSDCIIWFDPKSGADATIYSDRVNVIVDPINSEPYQKILKFILKSIIYRNQILSTGNSISNLPRIVLLIDEWYLLSAIAPKNEQLDIQNDLRRIVATGRSANVSVILSTQRPTSQTIDVTTRELCNTRIAFYCGDIHSSEAILGQSGAEDKTNPLRPGEALVWLDGKLDRTTLFKVPEYYEPSHRPHETKPLGLLKVRHLEKSLCQQIGIEVEPNIN